MKKTNRIISALLMLIMLLTIIPAGMISAGAEPTAPTINIGSASVKPGSTVEIDVEIQNNPGVLGATFSLSYGEGLTLTNAEQGEAFEGLTLTKPGRYSSPCNFAWDGIELSEDQIKDGVILTLTFVVAEDIEGGTVLPISFSYDEGDVIDTNLTPVALDINNGTIEVIDYIPGDADGNLKVNTLDVILIRRYIAGGYDVEIDSRAANVNGDHKINTIDIIFIRRFIAGGYLNENGDPLELMHDPDSNHSAESPTEASTEPTWDKHPIWITYHLYDGDAYLESVGVDNPNPDSYQSGNSLKLVNLRCDGYIFDGWYDGEGANAELVKSLPADSLENEYELYARWRAREYTISFNSPLLPVESMRYSVNTGAALPTPELYGYTFFGWSDEYGVMVNEIPIGTTGNITLYANWSSRRNQTRTVSHIDEPIVLEDTDAGEILFAYKIGTVENIPIKPISDLYLSCGGSKQSYSVVYNDSFTENEARNIANTIAKVSNDSQAWSLSSDWNDVTSISLPYLVKLGITADEAELCATTPNNNYSLNSSKGGIRTQVNPNGLSSKISGSLYIADSYERNKGMEYCISEGHRYSTDMNAQTGRGLVLKAGDTAKECIDIQKTRESGKTAALNYTETGTANAMGFELYGNASTMSVGGDSMWNSSESYSASLRFSHSAGVSNVLSDAISEKYGISCSDNSVGVGNRSFVHSDVEDEQYAVVLSYRDKEFVQDNVDSVELGGEDGYYRVVLSGTAHVFAVVGYDVASRAYYTYTFAVMDDETHLFVDYSKTTSAFSDEENGVLPFEVPFSVKEYVDARQLQTAGFHFRIDNQEAVITNYSGTDDVVFIPAYIRQNNGDDTYTSVKVSGITSTAFQGNTDIQFISLSSFIEEIPENAFRDCTSLSDVFAPGVKRIGDNAFMNCTGLKDFTVSSSVQALGSGAFNGASGITVNALSKETAVSAVNSGAERLTLDISDDPEAMDGLALDVPDSINYFELKGKARDYTDLLIRSEAATTALNGLNITNTGGVPLKLASENIILNRLNVNSTGCSALFTGDNTDISLCGYTRFTSADGCAVICRNLNLSPWIMSVPSNMTVSGALYTCGSVTGLDYLRIDNGSVTSITEEEYEQISRDLAD